MLSGKPALAVTPKHKKTAINTYIHAKNSEQPAKAQISTTGEKSKAETHSTITTLPKNMKLFSYLD